MPTVDDKADRASTRARCCHVLRDKRRSDLEFAKHGILHGFGFKKPLEQQPPMPMTESLEYAKETILHGFQEPIS